MSDYKKSCEEQFFKLLKEVKFDKKFLSENETRLIYIFKRIYVINLLKNRVELNTIFDENFEESFSLLLETTFSLFSGQYRASLLLLRTTLESVLKFITIKEREFIKSKNPLVTFEKIDYRFSDTKRKLLNDIGNNIYRYPDYSQTIEKSVTYYKNLSSVVHSVNKKKLLSFSSFYLDLQDETLVEKEYFFKLHTDTLNNIFTLLFFLSRKKFKNWDTYDLQNILKVMFKKENQIKKYMNYVKLSPYNP
ncbi:hypothetical protein [Pseudolactococcus raffinolactis]|uniref:hypothetical protein n=1 Tax=Pseudolactococcus raffinolactis TaxID=1366 RepID=UPI001436BE6D|nr:hypothetical protein [Lactococcus raffinolactis]QIW51735.1 hypothetical protein GU337_07535 [Lactococcus raffinolactis]